MAPRLIVETYGFGSYFRKEPNPSDVDILIIHTSSDHNSCNAAIALKNSLAASISNIDIVVLSKREESEFNFINRSKAIHLHTYEAKEKEIPTLEIIRKICSYRV